MTMKFLLVILVLFCSFEWSNAQKSKRYKYPKHQVNKSRTKVKAAGKQKGVKSAKVGTVKLNLFPTMIGQYSLEFEGYLDAHSSFGLRAGYMPSMLFIGNLLPFSDGDGESLDLSIYGMSFSPYYKYYTSGDANGNGLYVSPYLKWNKYTVDFLVDSGGDRQAISPDFLGIGMGVQLGYQWIFASGFTVDWTFLGISVQRFKAGLTVESTGDVDELRDDYSNYFTGTPLMPEGELQFDRVGRSIQASTTGFIPLVRSMISLGYTF